MKRTHRLLVLAVGASALTAPAMAQAATLAPASAKPCFGTGDAVPLFGNGYTPNGRVQIARDGTPIGNGTADAAGNVGGFAAVPVLPLAEQRSTYTATDLSNPANVGTTPPVLLSQLKVGIRPPRGNPRRIRRIRTRGWTVRGTRVFAHVRRGRYKRNIGAGRLKGACRTSNKRMRLFDRGAGPGLYRVQFDTYRKFGSKRAQRVNFRVTIFRTVRRSSTSGASASVSSLRERWKLIGPPAGERRQ